MMLTRNLLMPEPGKHCDFDEFFYGSVTVGDRGQVVIPAEARSQLGIEAGDKLLVMRDPKVNGLMVCKLEAFMGMLDDLRNKIGEIQAEGGP
jgi:AbrB family looped-hinge helix DNA binding protein